MITTKLFLRKDTHFKYFFWPLASATKGDEAMAYPIPITKKKKKIPLAKAAAAIVEVREA